MNRRGFISTILALGAAPAIVRADSLMRLGPAQTELLLPFSQEIIINQMRGPHQFTLADWWAERVDAVFAAHILGPRCMSTTKTP